MKRSIGAMIAAGVALAMCASDALAQGGPPPAPVAVGVLRMREVDQRQTVTGDLRAVQRSLIATREPGLVTSILIAEGDEVEAGQVLATLDDSLLRIDMTNANANLRTAQAQLVQAESDLAKRQRDLSRLQTLAERGSATGTEIEDAQTQVDIAEAVRAQRQAEIEAAQSAIARIQERLDDMTIRAPFNARITGKNLDVGEWAAIGQAVVEVVTADEIDAWVDVPERFLPGLRRAGASLRVRVSAAEYATETTDFAIVPVADRAARTFPVRVRIKNGKGGLLPGMTVVAEAPTGVQGMTLVTPSDALLRDDAGWFVYTATDDGNGGRIALPARVEPLFTIGAETAIRVISGPAFPGAVVAVEGNERIMSPGQPLAVSNPEAMQQPQQAQAEAGSR